MSTSTANRARESAKLRSRALQHEIMALILERGLLPGDPLPTELELVEELGVGRNTVREALKVLQAIGIVDVRHGYGMFVAKKKLDALAVTLEFHARMSLAHSGREAVELVDVRQALESELIAATVDAMTPDALAAVLSAVQEMEACAERGASLVAADREFHRALFAPLENALLSNLLDVFWAAYSGMHETLMPDAVDLAETSREHRGIYEAVAAADKTLATELMRGHFDGIRGLIKRSVGE
ncbi:MAG: FCD domain-containing protein [Arthrobacter sp.]|jgi:DNA-binding FadR family transcriptional regulator|nr:FCD domain-containing protein [Arthrobacter sp.]